MKVNLTDILVTGVENNAIADFLVVLESLHVKLASMNMTLLATLMQDLIAMLKETAGVSRSMEQKARVATIMLRIITAARLFETQLNLETVKRQMLEMPDQACKSN